MGLPAFALLLALQDPRVPEGYGIRKAAETRFPMFACLDERGRLYVTESSGGDLYLELQKLVRGCRVRRFEDRDGDGIFEHSGVFAEGLTPSMGLAWRDGKLYVADPPDLAVLEDRDGDGRAETRSVILTGFGHRDNGSLHGLIFGPDGWLYMTTGQPDGYALKRADGSVLRGTSGALLRCRPDGSEPQVISRGFENLVEVAFLPGGDIVGTCNWYQKPAAGIRDALVHLLEGARFPYAPDEGTVHPWTGRVLPAVALFPAVAFSGLCRYEGTAFPADARGRLFAAQFNARKISRHELVRRGSTYGAETQDFVTSEHPDFHPSDVLEAPDGSLLVLDSGAWYTQHCPTGKIRASEARGGIWRVSWTGPAPGGTPAPAATAPVVRAESVPELLAALDGADAHLEHSLILKLGRLATTPALETALRDESPRIRRAALIVLESRGLLSPELVAAQAGAADPELRKTALEILQAHRDWAPAALRLIRSRIESPAEPEALRGLILAFQSQPDVQEALGDALGRGPAPLRIQLLETLASSSIAKPPSTLRAALAHEDPGVRHAAVRAVATLGFRELDEALAALAGDAAQPDALRLDALRAVAVRRPPDSLDFLFAQAAVGGAATARLAAAETLARLPLSDAELARLLQAVRGDGLVSPSLFLPALKKAEGPALEAAAEAVRAGWRPSAAELGTLLARLPADARTLIERAGDEAKARLTRYEPLLSGGDPLKGREVFFGKKVACGGCHAVGAQGGRVGPDLTKIGEIRAGRDLLESILLPSSTFAQGYDAYLVLTRDGDVRTGVIAAQSADSILLRDASGAETRLNRSGIRELKRAEKSVMPEGLERALSDDEFRDLLAYLRSLK